MRLKLSLISAALAFFAFASIAHANPCRLGRPILERQVIQPTANTFYSVDALNPDVVKVGKRYFFYFSGNDDTDSHVGHWRTGVAIGRSPLGPFRVTNHVFPFLNGGTVWDGQTFYQAANFTDDQFAGALYASSSGLDWNILTPFDNPGDWSHWRTDPFIFREPDNLAVYFAARPGPVGADIAVSRYSDEWSEAKTVLRRGTGWDNFDLGEPAVFKAHGRKYMLYVASSYYEGPRQIGLAYFDNGWVKCGRFIGLSPRYPQNAIDPSPLVVGNKLYVYFGGGSTSSSFGAMDGRIWVRVYKLDR